MKCFTNIAIAAMAGLALASPAKQPCCLTKSDVTTITNNYADLIGDFTADKALAYLTPDFQDTSDSINVLSGIPLGSVTFPSRDIFIQAQSQLPSVGPLTIKTIHSYTCDVITLTWTQTFGQTPQTVQGIAVIYATKSSNKWLIKKIFTEFNSLTYFQNIGGTTTPPGSS